MAWGNGERTTDRPQKPRERMRTNVHERNEKRRILFELSGETGPLITVWLEVRILPGPPRTPIRTECSGNSSISPPIGGCCAGTWSPVPGAWFWLAFSPLLSLGSANPFLARASRLLQAGSDQPIRPSIAVWRDHSTGASRRRVTPMPRGNRPSIAAFTRSGARKARDIVMLTWRTLHPSRLAMRSTSAFRIHHKLVKPTASSGNRCD